MNENDDILDLNTADGDQVVGGPGPIPPHSCVVVRMHVEYPEDFGRDVGSRPYLTRCKSGLEQMRTRFEVILGKYAGRKIYHNFNLRGATTPGQLKAINISVTHLRLIVEVARGIDHNDMSPSASDARKVSPIDLDGAEFPIMVECEKGTKLMSDGTQYFVNNTLYKILMATDPEYQAILQNGEAITTDPLPVYPAEQTSRYNYGGGYGGMDNATSTAQSQGQGSIPVPGWVQRANNSRPQAQSAQQTGRWQQAASASNAAQTKQNMTQFANAGGYPPPPPMVGSAQGTEQADQVPF